MTPAALKTLFAPFATAAATATDATLRTAAHTLLAPGATVRLCHPFGEGTGPGALLDGALGPLLVAIPDLERREAIRLAGTTPEGQGWIGCMGSYLGTFAAPFLDIPPTGQLVHMRYHEFFRVAGGQVVEVQAIWDIPELMMQAGAWPMGPQLGAALATPAPMTQDGLTASGDGADSLRRVQAMLADMGRHPADPDPSVMNLPRHWHPRLNWYGPAGIGTARGIAGFRARHQIPFLRALPDRGVDADGLSCHWIAEGAYVCETGWPNMRMTVSGDGWLGIAPAGQRITLRSLDFWRLEGGLIRENWVLVDLLDMWAQIGVDVLRRMREIAAIRGPALAAGSAT